MQLILHYVSEYLSLLIFPRRIYGGSPNPLFMNTGHEQCFSADIVVALRYFNSGYSSPLRPWHDADWLQSRTSPYVHTICLDLQSAASCLYRSSLALMFYEFVRFGGEGKPYNISAVTSLFLAEMENSIKSKLNKSNSPVDSIKL